MPWIDPRENDPDAWRASEPGEPAVRTVYERAYETAVPYERRDDVYRNGEAVTGEFRTREYEHAKVSYHLAVEGNGRVKLLAKGHLWGDDEVHQRFRAQYRRPGEPTDTEPFDDYHVWVRFRLGTVARRDGSLQFEPTDEKPSEKLRTLAWGSLFGPDRVRLAELELVRNPPLARYVLRERDQWAMIRDSLRYNPDAFTVGP